MTIVENASQYMEKICNDNSHGYSQSSRWPEQGNSFDCSSLVITCYDQAGVSVRKAGASYTGNMYSAFRSCGFEDVTSQCNLSTGGGIKRGDVLLNYSDHTALYLGNGKVGHARSSEGTSDQIDGSGNEIRVQSYWNYPWNCVLRYPDSEESKIEESNASSETEYSKIEEATESTFLIAVKKVSLNSKNVLVAAMQAALKNKGYNIGVDGIDGDFGYNTLDALKKFQVDNELQADGICGRATWIALLK